MELEVSTQAKAFKSGVVVHVFKVNSGFIAIVFKVELTLGITPKVLGEGWETVNSGVYVYGWGTFVNIIGIFRFRDSGGGFTQVHAVLRFRIFVITENLCQRLVRICGGEHRESSTLSTAFPLLGNIKKRSSVVRASLTWALAVAGGGSARSLRSYAMAWLCERIILGVHVL